MKRRKQHLSVHWGFFFLLMLAVSPAVTAQEGPEPVLQAWLVEQPFDVRSLALGEATLADRWNLSPMGVNASLLGLRDPDTTVQFNLNHHWSDNQMVSSVTLPVLAIRSHRLSGRFGLSHDGSDQFNYLGSASESAMDLQLYHADIAYAYRFSDAFSMGVLNRVVYMEKEDDQLVGYSVDLGLVYAPQGKITYGMIARGIGRQGVYGPRPSGGTRIGSTAEEVGIEVGATINFPLPEDPFLSLSFSNEKRLFERGIWYKGGVEVMPLPMISLRSGIKFHLEQSLAIPRYGMGVHVGIFHLDYTVSPHVKDGEQFHQLGVTLEF